MEPSVDDLLSFKEFPLIPEGNANSAQLNIDSPKKVSPNRETPTEEGSPTAPKGVSFLSFEFYQRFFDVDTMTVVDRIANAIIPKRAPADYLQLNIGTSPDLYGPTWIGITLIFAVAITANMADYLQNTENHHWRYNFHLVTLSASVIFIYIFTVPFALWSAIRVHIRGQNPPLEDGYYPSLLSLVCIYGYSLAIFIPVSILWTIQVPLIQWLLVATSTALTAFSVIWILIPPLKHTKLMYFLAPIIAMIHFTLAGFIWMIFFSPSHPPETAVNDALRTKGLEAALAIARNSTK